MRGSPVAGNKGARNRHDGERAGGGSDQPPPPTYDWASLLLRHGDARSISPAVGSMDAPEKARLTPEGGARQFAAHSQAPCS